MFDCSPLSVPITKITHFDSFNQYIAFEFTVELQSLEHLWDYENMFETVIVRANEY